MEQRKNIAERVRGPGVNVELEFVTMREMINHTIRSQFDLTDWMSMYDDYQHGVDDDFTMCSVRHLWSCSFVKFPTSFRDTCRKIEDFDARFGYDFEKPGRGPTSRDDLVSYCEYVMTLVGQLSGYWRTRMGVIPDRIREHVGLVLEKLGYVGRMDGPFYVAVPKDETADRAAASAPDSIAVGIHEYRHRSWEGDLVRKARFLSELARHLEPRRTDLKRLCPVFESGFFAGVNNLNIRHNNVESGPNFKASVAAMDADDIERHYDTIYQLGVRLLDTLQIAPSLAALSAACR